MLATAPVHRDRSARTHLEQDHGSTPMMSMVVTWLMKNPLGAVAQPGARGDFVRVSDGRATIYLLPDEFDDADERRLRWLLAQQPTPAVVRSPGDRPWTGQSGPDPSRPAGRGFHCT
jgi:hypothetical protein